MRRDQVAVAVWDHRGQKTKRWSILGVTRDKLLTWSGVVSVLVCYGEERRKEKEGGGRVGMGVRERGKKGRRGERGERERERERES